MAEITGGELKYVATLDTSQLDKSLTDSEGKLKGFTEVAEIAGEKLENSFKGEMIKQLKDIGLQSELTGKELKDAIQGADEFIKGMEDGLKEAVRLNQQLAKEISATPDSPLRNAMIQEWEQINLEIEDAADGISELKKFVEDVKYESADLSTKFNRVKAEMEQLVYLGKEGEPKYKALTEEANRLKNAMERVKNEIKVVTDPSGMQGFISILTAASGVAATAAGVYGLFGKKSEEIAAITEKINSIMAIAVGLQGVASQGMQAYATVTNMFAVAQTRLATAFGISTAAARVFLGVLTGGIAIALPIVIGWVSKLVAEKKQAAESQKMLSEAMKEGAKSAAQEVVQLDILYRTATNVNLSMNERLAAVERLKKSYPGHFAQIQNEIILNGKARDSYLAVRDAIVLASKARAAQGIVDKKTVDLMAGQQEAVDKIAANMMKINQMNSFIKSDKNRITVETGATLLGVPIKQDFNKDSAEKYVQHLKDQNKKILTGVTQNAKNYNDEIKRLIPIIEKGNTAAFESTYTIPEPPKVKPTGSGTSPSNPQNNPIVEEILPAGSVAEIRKRLSEIDEALSKANDIGVIEGLKEKRISVAKELADAEARIAIESGEKKKTEDEKALEQFLLAHRTFEQQKTAITEYYDKIRAGIDASEISEDEKTRLKAEAAEEQAKEISDAFIKGLQDNPEWIEAFGKLENYTLEKLQKLRTLLVKQLSKMRDSGAAASDIKAVQDQIQKMDALINKTSNPFELIKKGIKAIGNESLTAEEKLAALNDAVAAMKGLSSTLKDITGGIKDVFTSLGGDMDSAFGDIMNNIDQTIDGLNQFGEGAAEAISGFASGNYLQAAAGAIKAIGGAIKAVSGWFNGDAKKERNIKKWAEEVEGLRSKYEELQQQVKKALGEDVYADQQKIVANLRQQQAMLTKMMNEESKKKKADKNKINDYKREIESINQAIEDIYSDMANSIAQTDAKGLADQLADALIEAYGKGEDAATAYGKVAEDVMKQAVKNALKMQLLEKPMQNIVSQMLKSMGFDDKGNGTFDGLSEEEREHIKSMFAQASENYMNALGAYSDMFGDVALEAQGMKGDIKGVTERTAGALESQINAMRIMQAEHGNIFRQLLIELVKIEINTRRLHNIDKNIEEMNQKTKNPLAGIN